MKRWFFEVFLVSIGQLLVFSLCTGMELERQPFMVLCMLVFITNWNRSDDRKEVEQLQKQIEELRN